MVDFVMCARSVRQGQFTNEPGPSLYLEVPDKTPADPADTPLPLPAHKVRREVWIKRLRQASVWGADSRISDKQRGDILVFIHGYNNDQAVVMRRHRRLKADLHQAGFRGVVLSFDWPSAGMALNYLEDRHDAKQTSLHLMNDGIYWLAKEQTPDCTINVHLLGHSTGAYVIREAFDDADDSLLRQMSWIISQVVFIGGDVSAASLSAGNPSSEAIYRHCVRFTNYSNQWDSVLKLSNAKRVGMSPRVGRVGLPDDVPAKAVNINCSAYFQRLSSDPVLKNADQVEEIGSFDHSWHIGNRVFTQDLLATLIGDVDRSVIATRAREAGGLVLRA